MRIVLMIHERDGMPTTHHHEGHKCIHCENREPVVRVIIENGITTKHFGYPNETENEKGKGE